MIHSHYLPRLERVRLTHLRPTQLTVGYLEVALKARAWARLAKKQRKVELDSHVIPAVLGPAREPYIIDHHHLGIALMEAGVRDAFVSVLDDLSWLEPAVFWRTMEFRAWAHPYDRRGRRCEYREMPRRLRELRDDPYRSLAGLVRRAGGFAKDEAPFVEFLWADYYRTRVPARLIQEQPRRATRLGVRLAHAADARYLPGWNGKLPVGVAGSGH
jgi:hypothetical protein